MFFEERIELDGQAGAETGGAITIRFKVGAGVFAEREFSGFLAI